jgi:hypothetical protein
MRVRYARATLGTRIPHQERSMSLSSRPSATPAPRAPLSRMAIAAVIASALAAAAFIALTAPRSTAGPMSGAVHAGAVHAGAMPSQAVAAPVREPAAAQAGQTFHAGYALEQLPAEPDPSPRAIAAYEP